MKFCVKLYRLDVDDKRYYARNIITSFPAEDEKKSKDDMISIFKRYNTDDIDFHGLSVEQFMIINNIN